MKRSDGGFSVVEMIVAVVITLLLGTLIIAAVIGWLQTFSVGQVRNTLATDTQRALGIISDDIRESSNAVDYNQWPDDNAPTAPAFTLGSSPADTDQRHFWRSGTHSLILIRYARDSTGAVIYDNAVEFTGKKDNYVYYVNNDTRTLYRRSIPVPRTEYPTNALELVTCGASTVAGGCSSDFQIAKNVKINGDGTPAFTISYYNNVGIPVTGATSVRSVVVSLTLSFQQSGHEITETSSIKMVFRNN